MDHKIVALGQKHTDKLCIFQSNCSVYTDKIAWRTSRAYVNEQIRQLRAQLGELKEIRSHLKAKRYSKYGYGISNYSHLEAKSMFISLRLVGKCLLIFWDISWKLKLHFIHINGPNVFFRQLEISITCLYMLRNVGDQEVPVATPVLR